MSGQPWHQQPDLHTYAPHRSTLLSHPGNLQQALKDAQADPGKALFGVAQGIPSVFVTKVIASAKPDFIWIDVEHGIWNRLALYDAIQAAQHHSEGKTLVLVRVPKHDEISLTTALDAGAAGIVIPHCESADEVRKMVKEMYFPPIGARSFSPWTFAPGVNDQSLYPGDSFNTKTANNHVVLIPQIESVKGVENADEIASVEHVGGLMFGPGDFMADAGVPLTLEGPPHPVLIDAMTKFAMAGAKAGVPLFGAAQKPGQIPMLLEQGYRLIAVAFDVWALAGLIAGKLKEGREDAAEM
ncbi:Pyruvate/Phosphoenolpyruvate kinase-like domain-containing protein, partial [Microdochium trichocladiopsis]